MIRVFAALVVLVGGWSLAADPVVDRDEGGQVVRVRVFQDGAEVWDVAYADGLPRIETLYRDGQAAEVSTLGFHGRSLVSRTVRSPDGTLVFSDKLWYWPNGTLRRLERDGPQGRLADAAWSYGADGRVTGAWASNDAATHREWSYGATSTKETLVDGTTVVLGRVTEWLDAGRSQETVTLPASSSVTVRQSDADGRPVAETVSVKDAVVKTRAWTYDAQGRVATQATTAGGTTETVRYLYDGATALARMDRAGVLVREETRVDGVLTETRYYDKGALVLVETWSGGRKTKETYYQKGLVVRERTP
jgi:YD repeat-containing protein